MVRRNLGFPTFIIIRPRAPTKLRKHMLTWEVDCSRMLAPSIIHSYKEYKRSLKKSVRAAFSSQSHIFLHYHGCTAVYL